MDKYYTQSEAAILINVSESSIKLYIKELSDSEKKGKFNDKNQPNDLGIQALLSIAEDRNPYLKKYNEYEKTIIEKDKEIKELKSCIKRLKEEKDELNKRFVEYSEKTSGNFAKLQEQSNFIVAQIIKNNEEIKELSSFKSENKNNSLFYKVKNYFNKKKEE